MSISHESLRLVVPIDRTSANPEALAYAGAIARDGDEILLLNAIQLDD
ncbi:MAG: hypothetical protein IT334_04875, partial [Thermomicrobiales bacterium]|nr:hypothetical protein [Thermomicrobiales bacterium]